MKCRSKWNNITATIHNAIFSVFGEDRLEKVNNNTSSHHLVEWKTSEKTCAAYNSLFGNEEMLFNIGYAIFKRYHGKSLPTMHCTYVISICDILLNPYSSGIKCSNKSVTRWVSIFLVYIEDFIILQFFDNIFNFYIYNIACF